MKDFSNVKVGDKLVQENYNRWWGRKSFYVLEVVKITPKGHFRMNNALLIKNDGSSSAGYFEPLTPEIEKEMQKCTIISKAQDVIFDLSNIDRTGVKDFSWEMHDQMIAFAMNFEESKENTIKLKQLIETYREQHPEETPECIKCFSSGCSNYSESEPNNCKEFVNINDCVQYVMEGH